MAWKSESLTYDMCYDDLQKLKVLLSRIVSDAIEHDMKADAHIAITIERSQVADLCPIYKLTATDHEDRTVTLQSPRR